MLTRLSRYEFVLSFMQVLRCLTCPSPQDQYSVLESLNNFSWLYENRFLDRESIIPEVKLASGFLLLCDDEVWRPICRSITSHTVVQKPQRCPAFGRSPMFDCIPLFYRRVFNDHGFSRISLSGLNRTLILVREIGSFCYCWYFHHNS